MTGAEIVEKATRECDHDWTDYVGSMCCVECLEVAIDAALREERERCAKIAESFAPAVLLLDSRCSAAVMTIAATIRKESTP